MDIRVDLSGWGCLVLAALCLVLPLNWVAAAAAAATIHELCHILAVCLMGGKIHALIIGTSGAQIISSPLMPGQEVACILAGPAGSMALLMLRTLAPQLALCGLAQGIFNLLPVFPLDGGRALRIICAVLFPGKSGDRICASSGAAVIILLLGLGFWGSFSRRLGPAPLILSVLCLQAVLKSKISCKQCRQRVQ